MQPDAKTPYIGSKDLPVFLNFEPARGFQLSPVYHKFLSCMLHTSQVRAFHEPYGVAFKVIDGTFAKSQVVSYIIDKSHQSADKKKRQFQFRYKEARKILFSGKRIVSAAFLGYNSTPNPWSQVDPMVVKSVRRGYIEIKSEDQGSFIECEKGTKGAVPAILVDLKRLHDGSSLKGLPSPDVLH